MPTAVLPRAARRAAGVYYTPRNLVDRVVAGTLGPLLEGQTPERLTVRVVDPSCGQGAFLLGAHEFLLDWHRRHGSRLTPRLRREILRRHLFGVDTDAGALAAAKAALVGHLGAPSLLDRNLVHGDALLPPAFRPGGIDWPGTFPDAFAAGGFDAVVGNPPWGQKGIGLSRDRAAVEHLRAQFPSCRGIFDLFRPFTELSLRLLRPGGRVGLVLPDILLLKNYEPTRRLLLDHSTLDAIDWWGRRFDGAVIDAATVIATRSAPPPGHRVCVAVHDPRRPVNQQIPQADFHRNPRRTFNLFITPADRRLLDRLASLPKLGDFFEPHEGVHSGNIRGELFVDRAVDDTCRPLLLGHDEIRPYVLRWGSRYVRLGAVPPAGTADPRRYANVGRPHWHAGPKLLVRRTGDRVIAAVDGSGRYASNNFFLVLPRAGAPPCGLTLDGLCALLNSDFLTGHFRLVEPRRGRAFAELKIKHLVAFPLPPGASCGDGCGELNDLGAHRARVSEAESSLARELDERINALVSEMLSGRNGTSRRRKFRV